jgi:hypothetical protein
LLYINDYLVAVDKLFEAINVNDTSTRNYLPSVNADAIYKGSNNNERGQFLR